MKTALEKLSKEDLAKVDSNRDKKKAFLSKEAGVNDEKIEFFTQEPEEMLHCMQFGYTRDRFEGDPNQRMLPFEATAEEIAEQEEKFNRAMEELRKRPNYTPLVKLPKHLRVEVIEIHSKGDPS